MEETLMNAEHSEVAKIRTPRARIVVDGTAEKPYYSIEWFDEAKQELCLGYSSYNIENVFNWLSEWFEIVEAPKTNADRIRAMSDEELAEAFYAKCLCNYMPIHSREHCDKYTCRACVLEWLQQPVEGE